MKRPAPLELLEKEITLRINNLSHQGEGVGRIEGIAVFVPRALPGEEVRVRVKEARRGLARAELLEVVEDSAARRVPVCTLAGRCGGCSLQHLDYQGQLEFKTGLVEEALKRIGGMAAVTVRPTRGMVEPWRYRNKAQFHVRAGDNPPGVRIGYYLPGSRELMEVDDCRLMPADWSGLLSLLRSELNPLWQEMRRKGKDFPLQHILLRRSFGGGETALVLVVRTDSEPRWKEWLDGFLRRLPGGVTQVAENLNPHPGRTVLGGKTRVLYGPPQLREKIGELEFLLSPVSFYQVNPVQTEVLYRQVLEYVGLTGRELVLDLYCGAGTISLFLAKKAGQVIGVEAQREAVQDAEDNACLNGIENAEFHHADVEAYLERYIKGKSPSPDVVVLDPPRQGARQGVLKLLSELGPSRIVYVSCDPATLARDLRILAESGYEIMEAQPVDMFPQTSHIECVCLLERV